MGKPSHYHFLLSCLVLGLLLLNTLPTWARQEMEAPIPITTKSAEARQYFNQARVHMGNIQIYKAAQALDKALQLDPDFALAHMLRAQAAGPDRQSFREHYNKALALRENVSEGEQLMISVMQANVENRPEEAMSNLDKLAQRFPNDKYVHLMNGQFAMGRNDADKAITHFSKAVALDPNFGAAYNLLGYAYTSKEDYAKAEEAFRNYIKAAPREANPYDSMGDLLTKRGKQQEAIQNYKKAAAMDPEFNVSLTKVGHNYLLMGQLDESRKAYQYAESKAPTYTDKVDNIMALAESYLFEGRYKEALQTSDRGIRLLQQHKNYNYLAWASLEQAEIYIQMNDLAKAKTSLAHLNAAQNSPELAPYQKANLQHHQLFVEALIAAKAKDFAQANAKAAELKAKVDASANVGQMQNYHKLMGIIAYQQGNMKEALTHLAEADQNNPRVLYYQSLAEAKSGNSEKSAQLEKKLNTLNEPGPEFALVKASMAKSKLASNK
ncbi:tetratricopeptide repeat protein [Rufibacter aurantiacus]|uniref:tetratricopeptide repeat protein n=1 Tax=Rufibacter aurantiacus TaxID=2817374 RepID=UPI001B316D21|nr:tetratricopeptide repeat protein [Rufibacter aurantiacus]